MPRRSKQVVYKIPKSRPVLAGFPEDVRDAAALAQHAITKADKGDCDGALGAFTDAAQAFGRADGGASGGEKSQIDAIHPKLKRAQAAIGRCFRSSKR